MFLAIFVDELADSGVSSMILPENMDEKSIVESDKTFRNRSRTKVFDGIF